MKRINAHIVYSILTIVLIMLLPVMDYQHESLLARYYFNGIKYMRFKHSLDILIAAFELCFSVSLILFLIIPFVTKKKTIYTTGVILFAISLYYFGFFDYRFTFVSVQMLLLLVVLYAWTYHIFKNTTNSVS